MEEMKRLACIAAVVVLTASSASAIKVEKLTKTRVLASGGVAVSDVEVVSGEAKVLFKDGLSLADRKAALAGGGFGFVQELPGTDGWIHVTLPSGMSVSVGISKLSLVAGVIQVAANNAYRPVKIPNDPSYSSQYHLATINAPAAWEYEIGDSSGVTIAIMDAGIEGTHADLSGKLTGTSQFCDPGASKVIGGDNVACAANNPPTAACNHGTRVSGVAAASSNNGTGVAGVSWNANLISYKVFRDGDCNTDCSSTGVNSCATDDTSIINALAHIQANVNNNPARAVVNISIGGASACDPGVQTAITNAFNAGMVIVVSAGNDGGQVNAPAICDNTIPVGATDSSDNIASFSSRGAKMTTDGVVAPGVNIVTTDVGGSYTSAASGTSFSAPVVSGIAALILAEKPAFTAAQVKANIRGGTDGIGVAALGLPAGAKVPFGATAGAGRVNAFRTLKLTAEGTLAGFEGDQKVIAFPNPFRPTTHGAVTITIPLGLQSTNTKIRIYTMTGEIVRDLKATTSWDGKNDAGNDVASGVYLILAKTDAGDQKARVAVIR